MFDNKLNLMFKKKNTFFTKIFADEVRVVSAKIGINAQSLLRHFSKGNCLSRL